jgi:hypothetical protein
MLCRTGVQVTLGVAALLASLALMVSPSLASSNAASGSVSEATDGRAHVAMLYGRHIEPVRRHRHRHR